MIFSVFFKKLFICYESRTYDTRRKDFHALNINTPLLSQLKA